MLSPMYVTFAILLITIILFVSDKFRPDLVGMGALLALSLSGVITINEALAGFSNPVVIMIAGLFVVGGGIFRTGLAKMLGQQLIRLGGNKSWSLLIMIMLVVGFLSAIMSNVGTVAILLPVIVSLAISIGESPGKLLIPLAFASSLGGVLTLIGTPPNIIASETMTEYGYDRLAFFDFTPIGLIILTTGIIYMLLIGRYILPKSEQKSVHRKKESSSTELPILYKLDDYLFQVQVNKGSAFINKTLAELKLTEIYHVNVIEIQRNRGNTPKLYSKRTSEMAGPKSRIEENDLLILQGAFEDIERLMEEYNLSRPHIEGQYGKKEGVAQQLISSDFGLAEALLTPQSILIDQTISESHFREKYNVNVLAIHRNGVYITNNLSQEKLRFGDALLIQGSWKSIEMLGKETLDVVIVGQPQEEASVAAANGKAPIAAVIMIGMLLLMTFEILPIVTSVLIAAVLMIVTGCLRNTDDAYQRINWESLILIASMLPMATALEKTGGVAFISDSLISLLGPLGPLAVMAGFYIIVAFFSQFMSNTATAVIFAPIAITTALNIGVSPYPFVITVAVSASMAFSTPMASPTNAMVMTAGNYTFMDFVRIGIPLQFILGILMMLVIPWLFPF